MKYLKSLRIILIVILLLFVTNTNMAQFEAGKHFAGPSIGLTFLGSTFQLGANYEYGMNVKEIGIDAPGTLGIGGILRYWSYSEGYYSGNWSYTSIVIGVQGNYHFKSGDGKFDPWTGLILAYHAGSVSWDGPDRESWWAEPSYGGMWLGAHVGARYWISPTMALSGRLGFGTLSYGALDIGVDFKL